MVANQIMTKELASPSFDMLTCWHLTIFFSEKHALNQLSPAKPDGRRAWETDQPSRSPPNWPILTVQKKLAHFNFSPDCSSARLFLCQLAFASVSPDSSRFLSSLEKLEGKTQPAGGTAGVGAPQPSRPARAFGWSEPAGSVGNHTRRRPDVKRGGTRERAHSAAANHLMVAATRSESEVTQIPESPFSNW